MMSRRRSLPAGLAERGFSILELLVSLLLLAVIFLAMSKTFFDTTRRAHDHSVITHAEEVARTLLDFISYDIRMAGAGMPLGQATFTTTNLALGDAPLPVLPSSDATGITLRINETGKNTVLTSDLVPNGSAVTVSVMNTDDLHQGDVVYISDMIRGGTQGLRGTLSAVSSSAISIAAGYLVSPGASFSAGSTVTRISDIQYASPADNSGISRFNGSELVTLAQNSTFELTYLNDAGAVIPLPLTSTIISDQLAAVEIVVRVNSRQALKDGTIYTAEAQQRVALRNLNLNR